MCRIFRQLNQPNGPKIDSIWIPICHPAFTENFLESLKDEIVCMGDSTVGFRSLGAAPIACFQTAGRFSTLTIVIRTTVNGAIGWIAR